MSEKEGNYEEIIEIKVKEEKGRVDKYLAKKIEKMSRSKIQGLIENGYIEVNEKRIKANYKVQKNDQIIVYVPEPEKINLAAQDLDIDIIYQDKDIVVLNKAQGMVVHPAAGHKDGTLVNALLYHIDDLSGINGEIRYVSIFSRKLIL
ncbi:MAG: hypothetical protein L0J09_10000 [Lactococcus lactis]|nr:hypothetical protein [Lactococcus lactis]